MAFIDDEYAWPPDHEVFTRNQRELTLEYLAPYFGRHVAWNREGNRVLASGADMNEVEKNLIAAGIDPRTVVFGFVDDPDVAFVPIEHAFSLPADPCGPPSLSPEGSAAPSPADH